MTQSTEYDFVVQYLSTGDRVMHICHCFLFKRMDDFVYEICLKVKRNAHKYFLCIVQDFHQYANQKKTGVICWNEGKFGIFVALTPDIMIFHHLKDFSFDEKVTQW